jgi:hypothetical protein
MKRFYIALSFMALCFAYEGAQCLIQEQTINNLKEQIVELKTDKKELTKRYNKQNDELAKKTEFLDRLLDEQEYNK